MSRTNKRSDVALYEGLGTLPEVASAGWMTGAGMPGMGMGGGGEEAKGESLWKTIDDRMRGRWVYALTIGGIAAGVLAVIGYMSAEPMYESAGSIEISQQVKPIYREIKGEHGIDYYDRFVATQVEYIRGLTVLTAAAQDPKAKELRLSRGMLRDGLTVERDARTQLIHVSFESEYPKVAEVAVNAVLDAYYDEYGQSNLDHINNTLGELNKQVVERERRRTVLEQDIQTIAARHNATDLPALQKNNIDQIGKLKAMILEGERVVRQLPTSRPGEDGTIRVPTIEALAMIDGRLPTLFARFNDASSKFEIVRDRYNSTTLAYSQAEREFTVARNAYESALNEATAKWRALPPEQKVDPRMSQVITPEGIEAYKKELADLEKEQSVLIVDIARMNGLVSEEGVIQDEVQGMRDRMTAFELEMKPLSNIIKISQRGTPADRPTKDQRRLRGLMGLVAGMGGSLAFFFLLGTIDRRTYGASQLAGFGQGDIPPCLGVLPDLGASLKDPETSDIASHCVHQIRNQIEAVRPPQGQSGGAYVLAVSSPFQGDGKTSIIMALGWSYAAAGYNTLLIDCDMVGRSLTRQLGLTGREGLKEALVHKQLNGGVNRMPIANLSAVPVGVDARFGPENVRRIDLERLIAQVRDQYDIILVDTGPLLGSLESTPVMAITDGVVLSVRRGRSRTKLEDCINRLKVVGAECIGVILNCAARSDCNRYVSEASLAAAEEERKGRAAGAGASATEHRQPGERNILVKAVQNTTRSRALPLPEGAAEDDHEHQPAQRD